MLVTDGVGEWRVTSLYGFSERGRRHLSWGLLRHLANSDDRPWVVIGDFNDLLNPEDKGGRVAHPQRLFRGFGEVVQDYHISDIHLSGYKFMWSRG